MLDTIKALCALDGVSGAEDSVCTYIRNTVSGLADDVRTDALGNLIVFKKGRKTPSKSLMLTAHMDEVGVIITGITDEGYLKFASVGGFDRRVVIGKAVYIGEKRVFGIIGNKAYHLVKKEERDKIPPLDEMYIDIGAKSKDAAAQLVALGDTGTFDNGIFEFGNGFIKAKALDDRFGCAVMMKLLASELPVDCTFVFAVQEEVGNRGAFGAAFSVAPDVALIIETATTADLPAVPSSKKVCNVGKGVVIPFMDRSTIYHKDMYALLTGLSDENNIPWQTKTFISGGTDASAVQRSRGGVMTAAIAAPVRNLHSPSSVACISDMDAVYKLACRYLDAFGERY